MRPSKALLVAAAAAVFLLSGVDATVVATCKAAADSDRRVHYNFCVLELNKHHESPDADTWGLAKIAANMGINNADSAIYDINALLAKPGTDAKTRVALGQCQKLYSTMGLAFAEAYDAINNRNYALGKEKAGVAISQAHRCDDVFAKAAVPSLLTQYSSYTVKIAIVCTAITNLVK